MIRHAVAVTLAVITLIVTGCATAPVASSDLDQAAKTFAAKPGKANIYVYRNEHIGAAVGMEVILNGRLMGKTGAQSYFLFEVSPGKHALLSRAENDSGLDVVVESGRNYFVWQEVKMGLLYARTLLQIVDEATGRAGVKECQLLELR